MDENKHSDFTNKDKNSAQKLSNSSSGHLIAETVHLRKAGHFFKKQFDSDYNISDVTKSKMRCNKPSNLIEMIKYVKHSFSRYRHSSSVAETIHLLDTTRFFAEHFEGEHLIIHETSSQIVHIDIHLICPTENKPYYLLYTTGMSDLPMKLPEEADEEDLKEYSYCELCMLLPPNWRFDDESLNDEKWYWPIHTIKTAIRYHHEHKFYIFRGDDLQFGNPCKPFAENAKFCSLLFDYLPDEKLHGFTASDGCYINIYCCIPIYEEEMIEKINDFNNDGSKFMRKLFGENMPLEKLIIDINRKNVSAE